MHRPAKHLCTIALSCGLPAIHHVWHGRPKRLQRMCGASLFKYVQNVMPYLRGNNTCTPHDYGLIKIKPQCSNFVPNEDLVVCAANKAYHEDLQETLMQNYRRMTACSQQLGACLVLHIGLCMGKLPAAGRRLTVCIVLVVVGISCKKLGDVVACGFFTEFISQPSVTLRMTYWFACDHAPRYY